MHIYEEYNISAFHVGYVEKLKGDRGCARPSLLCQQCGNADGRKAMQFQSRMHPNTASPGS